MVKEDTHNLSKVLDRDSETCISKLSLEDRENEAIYKRLVSAGIYGGQGS